MLYDSKPSLRWQPKNEVCLHCHKSLLLYYHWSSKNSAGFYWLLMSLKWNHKNSTEKQKCQRIRCATHGCLCNEMAHKSQERVSEAQQVLHLGLDCDTPFFRLAAASEFCCMKSTLITACYRLYDQELAFRTHFWCTVGSQCQGKARRFASQGQCWVFLAHPPNALYELVNVACV